MMTSNALIRSEATINKAAAPATSPTSYTSRTFPRRQGKGRSLWMSDDIAREPTIIAQERKADRSEQVQYEDDPTFKVAQPR